MRRREILAQGAEPIGWKIGFNVRETQERLGIDAPLTGFLTTDTLLEHADTWSIGDDGEVIVESEVAVEVGPDGRSIAALFPALEPADRTGTRLAAMVDAVAARLDAAGEELRAGDRIITGIIAPPHHPQPGETVRLELEELGGVELRFS